ncbi:MAG: hypothetical protein V2A73_13305 [Pseudomonadota bacterium]
MAQHICLGLVPADDGLGFYGVASSVAAADCYWHGTPAKGERAFRTVCENPKAA